MSTALLAPRHSLTSPHFYNPAPTCPAAMATPSPALAAVLTLLDAEDFYSAHQKARTTATRLLSSRTGPASTTFDKKATEAANLLWEAGKRLLEKGQVGSGVDLATYLVEVWKARGVECGDEQRGESALRLLGVFGSIRMERRRKARRSTPLLLLSAVSDLKLSLRRTQS